MKIIRNAWILLWFPFHLRSLRKQRRAIRRYAASGDREAERRAIRDAENVFGDGLLRKIGIQLTVEGETTLPQGPVLFVSNHQSYLDIPVFFAAIRDKPFGFIAKESLGKIPSFGAWIGEIRSVFIRRENPRASLRAMEEGADLLRNGYSLVVFPEGTRSKGRPMGTFKKGSLRLATKAGVPLVPVTLDGTYKAYEETGSVRAADIRVRIHPAIETAGLSKKEAGELLTKIQTIIGKPLESEEN